MRGARKVCGNESQNKREEKGNNKKERRAEGIDRR